MESYGPVDPSGRGLRARNAKRQGLGLHLVMPTPGILDLRKALLTWLLEVESDIGWRRALGGFCVDRDWVSGNNPLLVQPLQDSTST